MNVRIISDLHIDINHKYGIDLQPYDDIFTIVAGDVAGDPREAVDWISRNIKRGIFISGNHDVYNDFNKPIEDIKKFYHDRFPVDSNISYLDYDAGCITKDIGENLAIVADVMYTDYLLPVQGYNSQGSKQRNMSLADQHTSHLGTGMNDFNWGKCKKMFPGENDWTDDGCGIYRLVPAYYERHHRQAFNEMTNIIESSPSKDFIVVTHHCLSPRCLSDIYGKDELDASYASDKEEWIKAHPNIKLIVSGHVHHRKSFRVGDALYVMNPLGYCHSHLMQKDENGEMKMWTPNCIVDTETWTVQYRENNNEAWLKQYEDDNEKLTKLASILG